MMFTEEMRAEDEKRWHARDVVTELGYCGKYMRDRKDMTNLDIRFYAYIMRKAHEMLKAQEPRVVKISELTSGEPMLVWLEDIDKKETVAGMIFDYVPGRLGFKLTDLASMDRIYPLIDEYLTRWRCWTSRPDEKVRADTPWSD